MCISCDVFKNVVNLCLWHTSNLSLICFLYDKQLLVSSWIQKMPNSSRPEFLKHTVFFKTTYTFKTAESWLFTNRPIAQLLRSLPNTSVGNRDLEWIRFRFFIVFKARIKIRIRFLKIKTPVFYWGGGSEIKKKNRRWKERFNFGLRFSSVENPVAARSFLNLNCCNRLPGTPIEHVFVKCVLTFFFYLWDIL